MHSTPARRTTPNDTERPCPGTQLSLSSGRGRELLVRERGSQGGDHGSAVNVLVGVDPQDHVFRWRRNGRRAECGMGKAGDGHKTPRTGAGGRRRSGGAVRTVMVPGAEKPLSGHAHRAGGSRRPPGAGPRHILNRTRRPVVPRGKPPLPAAHRKSHSCPTRGRSGHRAAGGLRCGGRGTRRLQGQYGGTEHEAAPCAGTQAVAV